MLFAQFLLLKYQSANIGLAASFPLIQMLVLHLLQSLNGFLLCHQGRLRWSERLQLLPGQLLRAAAHRRALELAENQLLFQRRVLYLLRQLRENRLALVSAEHRLIDELLVAIRCLVFLVEVLRANSYYALTLLRRLVQGLLLGLVLHVFCIMWLAQVFSTTFLRFFAELILLGMSG